MEEKKRIKLIWDFRGEAAQKTATHHEIHLNEFIDREGIKETEAGSSLVSSMHSIAFLITPESNMIMLRNALRPSRGEIYES